jgi:hypothetical protein
MINCGSVTFVLRAKRVFLSMSMHKSVRYWTVGWFYIKNEDAPDRPSSLPAFVNRPLVKKESSSYILDLAQFPE